METVVELLEVAGLVLVLIYLLSHARKAGGCGCKGSAVDDVKVNAGSCS